MRRVLACAWVLVSVAVLGEIAPSAPYAATPLSPALSVGVSPEVVFPIGGDAALFTAGGGVVLSGSATLPSTPWLSVHAEMGYAGVPVRAAATLSLIDARLGAGFTIRLATWLDVWARLSAGYCAAALSSQAFLAGGAAWEGSPSLSARAGATVFVTPSWSLGIHAFYRAFPELVQLAGISLEGGYTFGSRQGGALRIERVEIDELFPAMYLCYGRDPPGRVTLRNAGRFPATDVELSVLIDPYMSRPSVVKLSSPIEPGDCVDAELPMSFTDRILAIVEGTEFPAQIRASYTCGGSRGECVETVAVRIHGRNALTWEDERKAALFVSEKDPAVQRFAGNAVSAVRSSSLRPINLPFRLAVGLAAALCAHGIVYIADPSTPYAALVKEQFIVDLLRFPRQTLAGRAGDCDDLTILFCALLESMDVEAAFITVPGHIYPAVSLALKPAEARRLFVATDDLVMSGEKTWLPLEITAISGGFLEAWRSGARQWREAQKEGRARLLPVREAWKAYAPVSLAAGDQETECPAPDRVRERYEKEARQFIDRELTARIALLKEGEGVTRGTPREHNSIGVLYAQYGLYDEARAEFLRVLEQGEYPPALLNMGNIALLKGEDEESIEYYSRVLHRDPGSWQALLGLAQASHRLGRAADAGRYYAQLRAVRPEVASRHAYLVTSTEAELRARAYGGPEREAAWLSED
jgi:hypothetical protein